MEGSGAKERGGNVREVIMSQFFDYDVLYVLLIHTGCFKLFALHTVFFQIIARLNFISCPVR